MFFKDFVSVKRKKIKKGASQTYDTPSFFCFFANKCVVQATARDGGQSDYLTYFGGNGTGAAKELA